MQAFFQGGVLSVTGDEGPNTVEIVWRSDGGVEVLGDGVRHSFGGVRELSVSTGAGHDAAAVSLPSVTDLVIDRFDARIDLGSGNDQVTIDDGGRITFWDLNASSANLRIELGTGADEVVVGLNQHDEVELDLTSLDGGDKILVGMLLPAVQKVHEAAARLNLNLGGGQNEVSIITQEVRQVELNLAIAGGGNSVQYSGGDGYRDVYMDEPFPPSCKLVLGFAGGGNVVDLNTQGIDEVEIDVKAAEGDNIVKHELGHTIGLRHEHTRPESSAAVKHLLAGDGNQVTVNTPGYEDVDLDLDLLGNHNQVAIHLPVVAVQKVREAAARVELNFGAGGNVIDVLAKGIDDVDLSILASPPDASEGRSDAGGDQVTVRLEGSGQPSLRRGNWVLDVGLGSGSDEVNVVGRGIADASLNLDPGYGDDLIGWDFQNNDNNPTAASVDAAIDLGPGNDTLSFATDGIGQIGLDLKAGDGNDKADVRFQDGTSNTIFFSERFGSIDVDLGAGNDDFQLDTRDLGPIELDVTAGDGDDNVEVRSNVFAIWPTVGFFSVIDLGSGDDHLSVNTSGPRAVHSVISTGDGDDEVTVAHKQKNWLVANFEAGGIPAGSLDQRVDATIDLGAGDDSLVFVTDGIGQVGLDLKAGDGNDKADVRFQDGTSNTILFSEKYGRIFVDLGAGNDDFQLDTRDLGPIELNLTAGDGDDDVQTRNVHTRNGLLTTPLWGVGAQIRLGAGADRLRMEINGHGAVDTSIDAGAGDDTVAVDAFYGRGVLKSTDSGSIWNVDLGDGDDLADFKSQGSARSSLHLTAGAGNDQATVEHRFKPLFAFMVEDLAGPAQLDISVNLGEGDDLADILAGGFGLAAVDLDAGPGHDQGKIVLWVRDITRVSSRGEDLANASRLDISANLGDGDDRLETDATDYRYVNLFLDGGAGHDQSSNRLYVGNLSFDAQNTSLNAVTLLGAGDDHLEFDTSGYREVRTRVETGPEGDGRDNIVARLDSRRQSGLQDVRRLALDGGMDAYEHFALGYTVQVLAEGLVSTEYLFVA